MNPYFRRYWQPHHLTGSTPIHTLHFLRLIKLIIEVNFKNPDAETTNAGWNWTAFELTLTQIVL